MSEFRMPILGAEMESGRLVEWRVRPGDRVKRGDIVAVVDTDKAAIEVEIWEDGVVEELLVHPDETVAVGTVLARIRSAGAAALPTAPAPTVSAPAAAPGAAGGPAAVSPRVAPPPAERNLRATPAARRLAADHGIALDGVTGSGPGGAITIADVEHAIAAGERGARAEPATTDRRAAMRRAIAGAMARSKREIPHYYLERTVDMEAALGFLAAKNSERPVTDRLLVFVLEIKAVALALSEAPELNGHWLEDEFRASATVHAGVAIALRPAGLVAPALHAVETKSLDTLMREFTDLTQRARSGTLRSSELGEATITANGLGDRGADVVHGIIYPPQVALVGFGRVHEAVGCAGGTIAARRVCRVSVAADHRASDGHRGSVFLEALDRRLQRPEAL
jgi:pyruvate dehydrogenase E2 component (dihydrolipoamide acetyltransferase)